MATSTRVAWVARVLAAWVAAPALATWYDAGAATYFDALAAHAYGDQSPAEEPPAADRINFRHVELVREVMVRNGEVYHASSKYQKLQSYTTLTIPTSAMPYCYRIVMSSPALLRLCYKVLAYHQVDRKADWATARPPPAKA